MKIKSIKLLKEGVDIEWQTPQGPAIVTHNIKNGASPAPSLRNAIDDLKSDVRELMEVPEKWMETVEVKGLNLTHDDENGMDVTISFTRRFKSGRAQGFPTPRVRERVDHTQNGSSFMSEELQAKVNAIITETERYINGFREQTEHAA